MRYSRDHPSPRYIELRTLYCSMHVQGETFLRIPAELTFPGKSLFAQATHISRLIRRTGARSILDYGSGKGRQYEPQAVHDEAGAVWPSIIDYWGVDEISCYDPCYEPFSALPEGKFDGVISTDVLEHCPEEDIPWIVDELFAYAERFVFANVACFPARKRLPNGENAHCTIKPVEWWRECFEKSAAAAPGIVWEVRLQFEIETAQGRARVEERIGVP